MQKPGAADGCRLLDFLPVNKCFHEIQLRIEQQQVGASAHGERTNLLLHADDLCRAQGRGCDRCLERQSEPHDIAQRVEHADRRPGEGAIQQGGAASLDHNRLSAQLVIPIRHPGAAQRIADQGEPVSKHLMHREDHCGMDVQTVADQLDACIRDERRADDPRVVAQFGL